MSLVLLNSIVTTNNINFDLQSALGLLNTLTIKSCKKKRIYNNKLSIKKVTPFLKWAGGKKQILSELEKHLPKMFNNYYEPFLGGGSFYFYLKSNELISGKSYLGDYNEELLITYQAIKENPKELMKYLEDFKCKNNSEFFYELRAWDRQENFKNRSKTERAARFIYLNKTCYNGIWRVNSKGQNNVPYGKNINPSLYNEENIFSCAKALKNNTFLQSGDFREIVKNAKKGDFIFLDPPYDPISKTANFTSYNGFAFCEKKQNEVYETFRKLDKKGCFIMMTNNATDFIQDLFKSYISRYGENIISVKRYINCKGQLRNGVDEIIIKNY